MVSETKDVWNSASLQPECVMHRQCVGHWALDCIEVKKQVFVNNSTAEQFSEIGSEHSCTFDSWLNLYNNSRCFIGKASRSCRSLECLCLWFLDLWVSWKHCINREFRINQERPPLFWSNPFPCFRPLFDFLFFRDLKTSTTLLLWQAETSWSTSPNFLLRSNQTLIPKSLLDNLPPSTIVNFLHFPQNLESRLLHSLQSSNIISPFHNL